MSDRFKFRAYNKKEQCWEGAWSLHFTGLISFMNDNWEDVPEHIHLMQCTGLKDKNGKLIYEGDIVKIAMPQFDISLNNVPVIYNGDGFCVRAPRVTLDWYLKNFIDNKIAIEIVGNVYENPELLENKDEQSKI